MMQNIDEIEDELAKYAVELKKDLDSKKPRMYAPVVWAYQDSRVREAIAKRLAAGEILTSCSQIVPDRVLRRERVYFDFSPASRLDAKNPGILVQITDDNSVAEILDPFDINSDSDVPVATAIDTLPLFVSHASREFVDVTTAADLLAARWAQFVEQPELGKLFARRVGSPFGGGFGGVFGAATDTVCGGTPTRSSVISERGSKEDPDQDTKGGHLDFVLR
jgi:hypothetical protein